MKYKDTVEEIRMCSGTVDEIANAAGKAEIRDIRIYAQLQHQSLDAHNQRLNDIQNQVTELLIMGTGIHVCFL